MHYPTEELYAIVCLESHRHRTRVVGENLGTVPRYVDAALSRHGLARLHVAQFGIAPDAAAPLTRIPPRAFACVNTHDTPTFAGFLAGKDVDERAERGVLDAGRAGQERSRRQAEVDALRRGLAEDTPALRDDAAVGSAADQALLRACLERLARSAAGAVIVNLEDLWLETRQQNVPGTGPGQYPNWRRRARYDLERFQRLPAVAATLRRLARGAAQRRSRK